jgi:hypothetical protein
MLRVQLHQNCDHVQEFQTRQTGTSNKAKLHEVRPHEHRGRDFEFRSENCNTEKASNAFYSHSIRRIVRSTNRVREKVATYFVPDVQLKSGPYFNISNLFTKIYNMLYYTTNLYLQ